MAKKPIERPVQKNPFTLGRDYARVSVYLTKPQRLALIQIAAEAHVSVSEIVRMGLVREFQDRGMEFPEDRIEPRVLRKPYIYKEDI